MEPPAVKLSVLTKRLFNLDAFVYLGGFLKSNRIQLGSFWSVFVNLSHANSLKVKRKGVGWESLSEVFGCAYLMPDGFKSLDCLKDHIRI